jgi:hypothetical protein
VKPVYKKKRKPATPHKEELYKSTRKWWMHKIPLSVYDLDGIDLIRKIVYNVGSSKG